MELSLQKLTKAFNERTVFQNIDLDIPSGSRFGIQGPNGSGKSTLLKVISGGMLATSGAIQYRHQGKEIHEEYIYRYLHFVAPYNTVIEELTLPELFSFHKKLGTLTTFETYKSWVSQLDYAFKPDIRIKSFSSGMKQRIKLGLALLDQRPLLLLDEPGTNMDAQGKEWMRTLIQNLGSLQTIIIASNDEEELSLCSDRIAVTDFVSVSY